MTHKVNVRAELLLSKFREHYSVAEKLREAGDCTYAQMKTVAERLEDLLEEMQSHRGISVWDKKTMADRIRDLVDFAAPGFRPGKKFPSHLSDRLDKLQKKFDYDYPHVYDDIESGFYDDIEREFD